jgi:peptidoglycan/LPS O-acetylase OafA/YrhL
MSPTVSKILRAVGVLFTLFLAYTGLTGSVEQYPGIHSTGQWFQTAFELAFGVFGALSLIVTFRVKHWRRWVFPGFVLSIALAAGLAPVAWGQQGLLTGLVAGVASLLIAAVIVWLLRGGARHGPAREGSIDS